jgi:hypothetical protein
MEGMEWIFINEANEMFELIEIGRQISGTLDPNRCWPYLEAYYQ